MLNSSMKAFGGVLVSALNEGFTVDYRHAATGEVLSGVQAYYKSKVAIKDEKGRTAYENIPRIRMEGLPWDEKTMKGDVITAINGEYPGRRWEVTSGDTSPLGVTTLQIKVISR